MDTHNIEESITKPVATREAQIFELAPETRFKLKLPLSDKQLPTIMERKIGKVTFLIVSSSSETATDTIERKIEKLILRGCDRIS
jgi:hypothetical protein